MAGWRGSRPVRVGNGAWSQRQLDVYGELLGAAQRLVDQLGEMDPVTRRFWPRPPSTMSGRGGRPRSGEMIGNFPQAFSHIGLINASWAITQAQQRTGRT